ncbi:hypothetical protein V2J09_008066 [Rumex salicifolius]
MSRKFTYWQECTDPVDMDDLWSDPTVAAEWIDAGETKGEKIHLSRDPYGQPYLTQTEMRAVAEIVIRRHFASDINLDMLFTITELESARQPFATNSTKNKMEISYGLMQLVPKTAEWIFRDLGYQDYEIEGDPSFLYKPFINLYLGAAYLKWLSNFENNKRSEEFVVRAYKGGPKKATHKSTLPYWKRYLSVKESVRSRNKAGNIPVKDQSYTYAEKDHVTDQVHSRPAHPFRTQDDSQMYWDSRASSEDMEVLWTRRGIYREWMNTQQKKGHVQFSHDERKRPYISQKELLTVAEIIFTKHFSSTKVFTPAVLCALAEVVSMRYVDGVGSKTGLMGIDFETARRLYNESGYKEYKVDSVMDLKNPFASMYFAAAYLCWLSQYEDRDRSPKFVVQAYLSGPKNAHLEEGMGPDYCKYMAELNNYETMRKEMASAASASSSLSLLKNRGSSSSSSTRTPSVVRLGSTFRPPLRLLGFAGAAGDPVFSAHVGSRIQSLRGSGKPVRGVVSMAKKSVGDLAAADLKGKKVFVRADLNVPLDDSQNITDDTRIRAAVPTIKYLMANGAKVILSSHLGRPKGVTPKFSLSPLVPRLSELLGIEVVKADDCIGPEVEKLVASLPDGGVLLLENVRFYKEEEKNDPEFAKKLASLADLFVNDAFGTAHRAHASTEGVTKFLRPSVAGFLLQKELDYLDGAVSNPKRPFAAIVGGSKVSSKIGVIESLLEKCDILLLGGGMIFTFYKAQGLAVGSSLVEEDKLDLATTLLAKAKAKGVSLLLPTDVVIADKFAPDANSKIVPASAIPDGWMGLDIGPDSVKTFSDALDTTQTVIWNGPMGVFEFDKFAVGTEAIAKKLEVLSKKGVTTIIGGGDSVAAVEKVGVAESMSHISTGGGASLELLEGKELPGVLALDESTPVPV